MSAQRLAQTLGDRELGLEIRTFGKKLKNGQWMVNGKITNEMRLHITGKLSRNNGDTVNLNARETSRKLSEL